MIHPRFFAAYIALFAALLFKNVLRTLLAINGHLEFRQEFILFDPQFPIWRPYVDYSEIASIPIIAYLLAWAWKKAS